MGKLNMVANRQYLVVSACLSLGHRWPRFTATDEWGILYDTLVESSVTDGNVCPDLCVFTGNHDLSQSHRNRQGFYFVRNSET